MLPCLDQFIKNLHHTSYSDKTIYNYQRDLQSFDNFLKKRKKTFATIYYLPYGLICNILLITNTTILLIHR